MTLQPPPSQDTPTDTGSFQAGYNDGVEDAINTCRVDPLSCGIFDSVRYWEAYHLGVNLAVGTCKTDPGSCGISGAPWYQQGYSAGTAAMQASCVTDPLGCGVSIDPWYNSGFQTGFSSGVAQGTDAGFQTGFAQGTDAGFTSGVAQGTSDCVSNPIGCGVQLSSVLPEAAFGETEPNDNIVAADPLVLDAPFWGQSYGTDDTDWFYLETDSQNQTLVINFQVPGTTPNGWLLYVRDAAGNVFATIDTSNTSTTVGEDGALTYTVTLGLAGTYYIEAKSNTVPVTSNPYTLAAMLQDSPLETGNFKIGFYDAEVEFNNDPGHANPLATGVTMYGLINLTFNDVVPQDDEYVWVQGEDDDWFRYTSVGNEIVTLTFCAKDACDPGDWFVDVYNANLSDAILAYNTSTSDEKPRAIRFGLMQAGTYYMRVNHKRLFTAPCAGYTRDENNDGFISEDDETAACGCDSGYSCDITTLNPKPSDGINEEGKRTYPPCPDGSGGDTSAQCTVGCRCTAFGTLVLEVPEDAATGQYNFTWYGTKLPPFTVNTDAYQDFDDRASPY